MNNSLAIIITHNLKGKILTSNPMAAKVCGYSDAEYIDYFISDFLLEDDKPLFKENYLETVITNKVTSGTLRILNKQGEVVYTLYHNYLMEESGEEPYVISSAVDITSRIPM
ncbi:PAS domain S-box protein [Polaribacter sp. IC063]|nr:PAS domain S-box protein [Polaribacter sp. IC063]